MAGYRSHEEQVQARLELIERQVRGVEKMVELDEAVARLARS